MTNSSPHFSRAGFTLIELLVAVAVLAIILVIVGQVLGTTTGLVRVNNKHMDANDQARVVFDRMADDFDRMVRRKDVDYIFWKWGTPEGAPTPANDAIYFYTEAASYFDSSTFNTYPSGPNYEEVEKNEPSLVGYRVNNNGGTYPTTAAPDPDYYQLERLGKPLAVDSAAYNSSEPSNNSQQANVMVFLSYPPAGYDATDKTGAYKDSAKIYNYSNAYFCSTLAGAFSNNGNGVGGSTSAVGSYPAGGNATNPFNDSMDTYYRSVGSQVFRFEYSFQLKDGTLSDKPVMVYSNGANGVPSSTVSAVGAGQAPTHSNDSTTSGDNGQPISIGSRWWDQTNQIGYICLDATKGNAIWREIGIRDISAIIVTIAVIDQQGLTFVQQNNIDLATIAAQLPDYDVTTKNTVTGTVGGDPAYLLNPTATTGWAYQLLPASGGGTSPMTTATKLPQAMVSQIRVYQRYFYLNSF